MDVYVFHFPKVYVFTAISSYTIYLGENKYYEEREEIAGVTAARAPGSFKGLE